MRRNQRTPGQKGHPQMRRAALICVMTAALCLTAVGAAFGQPDSVLSKAVTICLECIGIG